MASDDNGQDAKYALSKLLQIGTVEDYQREFEGEFASPKAKGSLNTDEYIGVEEVVDGGEALGIGEDDDEVESGDISILNSLIGHESSRSLQLGEKPARGMFMCSSTMAARI
ncbi:hypothetical protein Tco_0465967, partial [Tanacetum coccineum]